MNLYLGEHQRIPARDIVAILPAPTATAGGIKSRILLADGRTVETTILPATLRRRLCAGQDAYASLSSR